jgi:hypothetical protein
MKKLLLLLFSILISFNSYGGLFGITSIEDATCIDLQKEAKGTKLKNMFGGEFEVLSVTNSIEISRTKDKLVCVGDLRLDNGVDNTKLRMELKSEDGQLWFKYTQDDNSTLSNEEQNIKPIVSRSKLADEVSNCKEITNNENRLSCYDNLNTEYALMIPSIEKLLKDKVITIGGQNRPFYGCIFSILYEDENLYEDKRRLLTITIGNEAKRATLGVSNFTGINKDDESAPKIGDCFAFESEEPLYRLFSKYRVEGTAQIYEGEYNVDESAGEEIILKNKLTIDEYYEQGILYEPKMIELTANISQVRNLEGLFFRMMLFAENGNEIQAVYMEDKWENNDLIKQKLRSIKSGDTITLKGKFEDMYGFNIFEIID